jgi:hypothetical protein
MKKFKVVVFTPVEYTQKVLVAMGDVGAGIIGDYFNCSFTSRGTGRFLPGENAKPFIGETGKLEEVEEDRIELLCTEDKIEQVIVAMKAVHPYEEVAYDVYALEDL